MKLAAQWRSTNRSEIRGLESCNLHFIKSAHFEKLKKCFDTAVYNPICKANTIVTYFLAN
jgi:hypothetical protein